jgi:hypothetical protein
MKLGILEIWFVGGCLRRVLNGRRSRIDKELFFLFAIHFQGAGAGNGTVPLPK